MAFLLKKFYQKYTFLLKKHIFANAFSVKKVSINDFKRFGGILAIFTKAYKLIHKFFNKTYYKK